MLTSSLIVLIVMGLIIWHKFQSGYYQYQKIVGMHSGMEYFQYVGYESLPKYVL